MTIVVDGELAGRNAQALERVLRTSRLGLDALGTDADRQRRADALAHIEGYAALLREPMHQLMPQAVRDSLQLVFPDGRWSVDEKQLADPPAQGDVVVFEGYGGWRIEGQQDVGARPAGKPPRSFFVCAPAA